jgi:hypothetical protein
MTTSYRAFYAILGLAVVSAILIVGPNLSSVASTQEKAKDDKPKATSPTKWEYRMLSLELLEKPAEKQLNALGEEGWEVVGMSGYVATMGPLNAISTQQKVILKRAKP